MNGKTEKSKQENGFTLTESTSKVNLKTISHLVKVLGISKMAIILKVFTLRSQRKLKRRRSLLKMKKVEHKRRSLIYCGSPIPTLARVLS